MARPNASTDDDAVPIKPEDLHVVLPVPHTHQACAGAATGFVMRRIAYRAGAYAPGIQEFLFHDLTTAPAGRSIEAAYGWLLTHSGDLHAMGYRVTGRRIVGERTEHIINWVKEGKGYRGAVLATDYKKMHPSERDDVNHAVGVTMDRKDASSPDELTMIDPWPGTLNGARDRSSLPAHLEVAHRQAKYAAIIMYWAGWS